MIGNHHVCYGGIANAINRLVGEEAETLYHAAVFCIGAMNAEQVFSIRSYAWNGDKGVVLKMGRVPYMLKMQNNSLCFVHHETVSDWGIDFAEVTIWRVSG